MCVSFLLLVFVILQGINVSPDGPDFHILFSKSCDIELILKSTPKGPRGGRGGEKI